MTLLPARRSGTVARPGPADSQAADLTETGDAYVALADGVLTVPKAETDKPQQIDITGG